MLKISESLIRMPDIDPRSILCKFMRQQDAYPITVFPGRVRLRARRTVIRAASVKKLMAGHRQWA